MSQVKQEQPEPDMSELMTAVRADVEAARKTAAVDRPMAPHDPVRKLAADADRIGREIARERSAPIQPTRSSTLTQMQRATRSVREVEQMLVHLAHALVGPSDQPRHLAQPVDPEGRPLCDVIRIAVDEITATADRIGAEIARIRAGL